MMELCGHFGDAILSHDPEECEFHPDVNLLKNKMRSDVIGIPNDLPEFLSDSKRNIILHDYFRLTTVDFVLLIH